MKVSIFTLVTILIFSIGCSSNVGSENGASSISRQAITLQLGPNPAVVAPSQSIQLTSNNGQAPFAFHVQSGNCQVNSSGLLYGSASAGACMVTAQDSQGNSGILYVSVQGSSGASETAISYSWFQSGFGTCSAATNGIQIQMVNCQSSSGFLVPDSFCSNAGLRPTASKTCNVQSTPGSGSGSFGHWVAILSQPGNPNFVQIITALQSSPTCAQYFFTQDFDGLWHPPGPNCLNSGNYCQVLGYFGPTAPLGYYCAP